MIPYHKVDKKAKRFRLKNHNILKMSFWKKFILSNREHSDISYDDFRNVIITFNRLARKEAIENREGIELPEIGFIFIGTCKCKTVVDHTKSSDLGFQVKELAWNTNNQFCKIFYNNYQQRFRLKSYFLWKFQGCRNFTKEVSAAYSKNWQKYIVIPPHMIISKISTKLFFKHDTERRTNDFLIHYNEFDLNE